jgi:hypothetical protein
MTVLLTKISYDEFAALPFAEFPFSPCLYDVEGMGVMYRDGRMIAAVDIEAEGELSVLAISTWDCDFRGKGYSRVSLEWLRERFDRTVIYGAGEIDEDGVGDIATGYWIAMHEKGLVHTIFLDDGSEITPEAYNMLCAPISPTI